MFSGLQRRPIAQLILATVAALILVFTVVSANMSESVRLARDAGDSLQTIDRRAQNLQRLSAELQAQLSRFTT